MEIVWFGSRMTLQKLNLADRSLRLGSTTVEPVVSVRNLGVYVDRETSVRVDIAIDLFKCVISAYVVVDIYDRLVSAFEL